MAHRDTSIEHRGTSIAHRGTSMAHRGTSMAHRGTSMVVPLRVSVTDSGTECVGVLHCAHRTVVYIHILVHSQ